MSKEDIYKNKNNLIKIIKFEPLFKENLISFLLNSDITELNSLDIFENLSEQNKKEKVELLTKTENIQIFILENISELIGTYFLKQINENFFISFIIKNSQRNKGYGKLGLHILINELSNLFPNISDYFFKINTNNIYASLIILGNNAEVINKNDSQIIYKIEKGNKVWIHRIGMDDIPYVMNITNQAKNLLKKNGSLQWQQGYPNEDAFTEDIKNNSLYGIYEDNKLNAFGAFVYGKDLNYVEIDGKWDIPANDKDMAIHRVAVGENNHGKKFGLKMLKYGIEYAKKLGCLTVKVDTHKNNIPMQKSILKSGFTYRGVIKILKDKLDNLRFAYEIVL